MPNFWVFLERLKHTGISNEALFVIAVVVIALLGFYDVVFNRPKHIAVREDLKAMETRMNERYTQSIDLVMAKVSGAIDKLSTIVVDHIDNFKKHDDQERQDRNIISNSIDKLSERMNELNNCLMKYEIKKNKLSEAHQNMILNEVKTTCIKTAETIQNYFIECKSEGVIPTQNDCLARVWVTVNDRFTKEYILLVSLGVPEFVIGYCRATDEEISPTLRIMIDKTITESICEFKSSEFEKLLNKNCEILVNFLFDNWKDRFNQKFIIEG